MLGKNYTESLIESFNAPKERQSKEMQNSLKRYNKKLTESIEDPVANEDTWLSLLYTDIGAVEQSIIDAYKEDVGIPSSVRASDINKILIEVYNVIRYDAALMGMAEASDGTIGLVDHIFEYLKRKPNATAKDIIDYLGDYYDVDYDIE